jgi:hypothetical protein
MAGTVEIVWDTGAVKVWCDDPASGAGRALDVVAARVQVAMKALCPVSPVQPVYAKPVPLGRSKGPAYAGRRIGKGLAWPGGPDVSRRRLQGDLPLRPSGYLRSSIIKVRDLDGSILIGPTAPYGGFVNNGTPPHVIRSTGPWPLRNRASGQVFGPVVRHPGTAATHFVEHSVDGLAGLVIRV